MNARFKAFSLIELLVVISIISLLIGIAMPALISSRAKSKQLLCQGNIRQLLLVNIAYAGDNNGYYVLAASDILDSNEATKNRHRWYGLRDNINEPFDLSKGPLVPYLQGCSIKCPTKVDFVPLAPSDPEYDAGSGGYGYNMIYIGSEVWKIGQEEPACKVTAKISDVRCPADTLMFADTAMIKEPGVYIEYSFAEPRYHLVVGGQPVIGLGWDPVPSIHFRHRGRANIGWADSHISSKKIARYDGTHHGIKPTDMQIGWFEPMDNSFFDLN